MTEREPNIYNLNEKLEENEDESGKEVIKLSEERRSVLENKLREYQQRFRRPESDKEDTKHKIIVLKELLESENGILNKEKLYNQIFLKHTYKHEDFCDSLFERAFLVIKEYAETGGKNVVGGTGLEIKENLTEKGEGIESNNDIEKIEKFEDIDTVITEKGSCYKYLPDGTTQRYKKLEEKHYEPQSALVYVPDYKWLEENILGQLEKKYGKLFDGEGDYKQFLLGYIHKKGRKIYIVDQNNNELPTNKEIVDIRKKKEPIFMALGEKLNNKIKIDVFLPVEHLPRKGFFTYDNRKYFDKEKGHYIREKHIGNKVVKIIKK
jgi:hypothetical protein